MRIELTLPAWEAGALPLSYTRLWKVFQLRRQVTNCMADDNLAVAALSTNCRARGPLPFGLHQPFLGQHVSGQPSLVGFLPPRWHLDTQAVSQACHEVEYAGD